MILFLNLYTQQTEYQCTPNVYMLYMQLQICRIEATPQTVATLRIVEALNSRICEHSQVGMQAVNNHSFGAEAWQKTTLAWSTAT